MLTLTCTTFTDGGEIPREHSCYGAAVPPELEWTASGDSAELALIVDDPDAVGGLYTHWIVTGLAASSTGIALGALPDGAREFVNTSGSGEYVRPCPPAGSGVHTYRFELFAMPSGFELADDVSLLESTGAIRAQAVESVLLTGTMAN